MDRMKMKLLVVAAVISLLAFVSLSTVRAQQWDSTAMVTVSQLAEAPARPPASLLPVALMCFASVSAALALLVASQRKHAVAVRIR